MRIAVLDETKAGEPRVAVTPDTIAKPCFTKRAASARALSTTFFA